MDNDFAVPEGMTASCTYTKFGYEYKVITADGFEFPMFLSEKKLNSVLLEILSLCKKQSGKMKVKLIYADSAHISLLMNNSIYLNYSIDLEGLLPFHLVIKKAGIKRRDVKCALRKAGKGLSLLCDSVRFTNKGVKFDAIVKKTSQKLTLRLTSHKKTIKIAKKS